MENLRARFISTAIGASSGMAGLLSLSKCSGGTCTSCFGCAGAGMGVLLLVLLGRMNADSAVGRTVIRFVSSLSAALSSFRYSRETHPAGSDTHGCFTLHFDKSGDEKRAKSLMPALPTAFGMSRNGKEENNGVA